MIHFLHRSAMYVGSITRENIVSFMHGVDFGRGIEPYWTHLLADFIFWKYKIKGGALGWPNQVEIYSKKENMDWPEAFKELMLQLIKESEQIPYTKKLKDFNEKMEGE